MYTHMYAYVYICINYVRVSELRLSLFTATNVNLCQPENKHMRPDRDTIRDTYAWQYCAGRIEGWVAMWAS